MGGGVKWPFLFNLVLTKIQDAFYRFLKLNKNLIYSLLKLEATTYSLWEAQTKNLSPSRFFLSKYLKLSGNFPQYI